jgi:hypothetical protein
MNPRLALWSALALATAACARADDAPTVSLTIGSGAAPAAPSVVLPDAGLFHLDPPPVDYVPATPMERALEGKLVRMQDGVAREFAPAQLAGVKFYALYFAAGWNASSRKFTEQVVNAYPKLRALYPEFEIVLVSRDQSRAAMVAAMNIGQMPWPALRWDLNAGAREITVYGRGIPCLVLVDTEGKVLADTVRDGSYVGSDVVLRDIWKILYDYRRAHPGPAVPKA